MRHTPCETVLITGAPSGIAPAAVTQALIPLLRKAAGKIVMISSESGFSSTPLVSPCNASKFALEALTHGLRLELKPSNIDVVSVQPGAIETAIWGKARTFAESALRNCSPPPSNCTALLDNMITVLRDPGGIPAEAEAEVVHNVLAVGRPKARYLVGRDATVRRWIERLPTSLRDRLILSQMPKYAPDGTFAQTASPRAECD